MKRLGLILVLVILTNTGVVGAATDLVGTIDGQFSTSSQGAANYSVPISVPPGIAGMEPRLSINYSSLADNGILGVGWALDGIPAIERCRSTYSQDNFTDNIDFDENDNLILPVFAGHTLKRLSKPHSQQD